MENSTQFTPPTEQQSSAMLASLENTLWSSEGQNTPTYVKNRLWELSMELQSLPHEPLYVDIKEISFVLNALYGMFDSAAANLLIIKK